MSERTPRRPRLSEAGERSQEARRARLGEALRANLRKRKAQARERTGADEAAGAEIGPSLGPGRPGGKP